MKFVADEGVDSAIVETLRNTKHEVFYVAEAAPGFTDDEVLELSNSSGALLRIAGIIWFKLSSLQEQLSRAHLAG